MYFAREKKQQDWMSGAWSMMTEKRNKAKARELA
jgi:hypothetical protein